MRLSLLATAIVHIAFGSLCAAAGPNDSQQGADFLFL